MAVRIGVQALRTASVWRLLAPYYVLNALALALYIPARLFLLQSRPLSTEWVRAI